MHEKPNGKILFTGGAGYIGSHVVRCFIEKGIKPEGIIVVDDLSSGRKDLIPQGCQFYEIDVTDEPALRRVFREHEIDAIFHFAGLIQVEESMRKPFEYFKVNVFGGLNVLNLMKEYKVNKIIFSSTAGVYGVPDYLPIDENHPCRPVNVYAEGKLMFEKTLEWFDRLFGVKYVALRYFNACGVRDGLGDYHEPYTHLIPKLALNLLGVESPFRLFGDDYLTPDGTCVRDFIDVRDLAEAHHKAYEYLKKFNQSNVFNLGSGKGHSVKEIIRLMEELSGQKVNFVVEKKRSGDPPQLVCSNKKAERLLAWLPKTGIKESILSHWLWFKENRAVWG